MFRDALYHIDSSSILILKKVVMLVSVQFGWKPLGWLPFYEYARFCAQGPPPPALAPAPNVPPLKAALATEMLGVAGAPIAGTPRHLLDPRPQEPRCRFRYPRGLPELGRKA